MLISRLFKNLLGKCGIWIYRIKYLPIGFDLKIDLRNRYKIKKIELVFDVGANVGQTHKIFRNYFPGSKIICFEPVKSSFEELRKGTKSDKLARVESFALGSHSHTTEIKLFDEWSDLNSLIPSQMNQDPKAKTQQVQVTTLDEYCEQNQLKYIDLLKIDTEGYEIEVLKGAEKKLKSKDIACIFCEIGFYEANSRNTNYFKLQQFLEGYDYILSGFYHFNNEMSAKKMMYSNALFIQKDLLAKK